jgi:hypothetical protein
MTWFRNIDKRIWYALWTIMGVIAIGYGIYLDEQIANEVNQKNYIILDGDIYERYSEEN